VKGLQQADIANDVDLAKIAQYGDSSMTRMNHVAELYVNASLKEKPNLRSVITEISWRQMILLQEIFKEAMMVALGEAPEVSALAFAKSIRTFEAAHVELLVGRVIQTGQAMESVNNITGLTSLFPDRSVPRTTDACMLTLMMNVLVHFENFKGRLQQVVAGEMEKEVELSAIGFAASFSSLASQAMGSAASSYSSGVVTCDTTLSSAEWESGLQQAGKTTELLQKAVKDFVLISAGVADTWMKAAEVALQTFLGAIGDDIESPQLAEAATKFKEDWFAIGKSDVERAFTLKTFYITQNPNPLGQKGRLDCEGPRVIPCYPQKVPYNLP
jgi:hypothetical protein